MAKPKISVIVPVYNVEPYLRRCVDSIVVQTLSDFEIILVDDGSTDGCGRICDEFASTDIRVTVIHKENGGLGSARNAGLDAARGDYLAFVDSDDCIAPEMYQRLLAALQKANADLSICGYQKINENHEAIGAAGTYPFEIITGMQALEKLYTHDYVYFTIACNKLFKRCVFDAIRFPEGKLFEDGYAAFRYYYASKTVVCLPEGFYFYLTRSNSITTSVLGVKNLDGLDAEVDSIDFLREKRCFSLLAHAQIKYAGAVISNLKRYNLKQNDIRLRFKEIKKDFVRLYPDIMRNRMLSNKEKVLLTSFAFSPRLCKSIITVKNL